MGTIIGDFTGTTIGIHSPIPDSEPDSPPRSMFGSCPGITAGGAGLRTFFLWVGSHNKPHCNIGFRDPTKQEQ